MSTPSKTPVPRYFEWNKLMAKARNPKPEIRKKSETRSPKGASSAAPAAAPTRPTHATPPLGGQPTQISDFGLLSDFGFRPSDFPHAPIPLKTANNRIDTAKMRVSIQNLAKKFGATAVLKSISLEIRDQELFFLLGPSGCGK